MTPEQINTAIAEWRGWEWRHSVKYPDKTPIKTLHKCWHSPLGVRHGEVPTTKEAGVVFLPDCYNDLNAMHEAVLSLQTTQGTEWASNLRHIVARDCQSIPLAMLDGIVNDAWFYNATAPQRAEALLRTIGRWRDE